jgi:3-oxoacid CoA-transferase subunit B
MDLVAGVGRVIVVMDHTNKAEESKVPKRCTLPLTGAGVVELAPGVTEAESRKATEATIA